MKYVVILIVLSLGALLAYTTFGGPQVATDETKGLSWTLKVHPQSLEFRAARDYCDTLELGGFTDWRMPNVTELRTIIDNCAATEPEGECPIYHPHPHFTGSKLCSGCKPTASDCYWKPGLKGTCGRYWTASDADRLDSKVWAIAFNSATIHTVDKYNDVNYVRCVRNWRPGDETR